MISFEEASRRGRVRYLRVKLTMKIGEYGSRQGGTDTRTLTVTIGRVERSPDGMFRYFEPETNELHPTVVDQNLRMLKKRIKAHSKR